MQSAQRTPHPFANVRMPQTVRSNELTTHKRRRVWWMAVWGRALEHRSVNALAALRSSASVDLRALVERSICASEVRQSWLRAQRFDDAA